MNALAEIRAWDGTLTVEDAARVLDAFVSPRLLGGQLDDFLGLLRRACTLAEASPPTSEHQRQARGFRLLAHVAHDHELYWHPGDREALRFFATYRLAVYGAAVARDRRASVEAARAAAGGAP